VVTLTAVTGVCLGGLAWWENRALSRTLLEATMARTARITAAHAARFLMNAEAAARLGPGLVAARQLDPDSPLALERFTLAVLAAHPELSWVSYGDRADRFVGAWRDASGAVFLNRSFPDGGRIRLVEDRILAGGERRPERRSDDHGYRPTTRPYFALARARREVAWTEPYEFYAGGGLGITCAAPLLDAAGEVQGVFTVDFSLHRLDVFLETLDVSPRGQVLVATREGGLLLGARRAGAAAPEAPEASLVEQVTRSIRPGSESAFAFEHRGERYLGHAVPLEVRNLHWLVAVVVPEGDYTDPVDAQARRTLVIGLAALGLALGGGVAVARWIARPLRELAAQARRIRRGDLTVTVAARSRDEIGTLARAMGDMAEAFRERDFIRKTLDRYVGPRLAERFLRDGDATQLGGERRDVAILMSDLRGFSELAERLGPEALIELVNHYLARMTPVILAHGGTIGDFIGDGILVLFGGLEARPDDTARAARCARAMQDAMHALNEDQRAHGGPELAMGIGVHAGPVAEGTIGSPDRVKYGVVGPAVNLAARIQSLAAGGEVLLSAVARARLGTAAQVGPPRRAQVKGLAEPITVYPLLGLGDDAGEAAEGAPATDRGESSGRAPTASAG
jgi:class 3 adenylate cyclase